MRLRAPPPDLETFDPASIEAGDEDLARRLSSLVRNLEHGSVAIFDGRWGVGKSTFVRRWLSQLNREGVPSIYVDAFAFDYLESPFVAIAGAFSKAVEDANKLDHPTYKSFVKAASKVGKAIGGTAAKIAVKAATLGVIGAAEIDGLADVKEALADAASERAEEAVKELIEEHSKKEREVSSLKEQLAKFPTLLSNVNQETSKNRLVVVIDELDRCRPDFALGMVESIKHFFGAPNVHFVIVTNRKHLILSVIHKYGTFETADEYLRKFYDYQIIYEQNYSTIGPSQIRSGIRRIANALLNDVSEREDIVGYLEAAAIAHRLTLRDIENVFANLSLAYAALRSNEFRPAFVITMLALLKTIDPNLYASAKLGTMAYADLNQRLFNVGGWAGMDVARLRKVFQYYLDPSLNEGSEEWANWGRDLWEFNLDRLRVIPYLCNSVLDRFAMAEPVRV